jgi:enterochelin esterase-like enzyme
MRRLVALATIAIACAACGPAHGHYSDTRGARVVRFTVDSRLLDRQLEQVGIVAGAGRRPLLVLLHGRSMPPDGLLSDRLFKALAGLEKNAPNIVFANGGDHSYFHDRDDGAWGTYILREVIPAAARGLGADPARVAVGGVSMGGFGALDLARLAPSRFCAVGGHSAALWDTGGDTPSGAFDNADDFSRHNVIGSAKSGALFGRGPVWLDVGTDDPFRRTDTELAKVLRARGTAVDLHVWDGGHNTKYWNGHMAAYLRFYAEALADC